MNPPIPTRFSRARLRFWQDLFLSWLPAFFWLISLLLAIVASVTMVLRWHSLLKWVNDPKHVQLAAWVQGIGSLLAVMVALALPIFQELKRQNEFKIRSSLLMELLLRRVAQTRDRAVIVFVVLTKWRAGTLAVPSDTAEFVNCLKIDIPELFLRLSDQVGLSDVQLGIALNILLDQATEYNRFVVEEARQPTNFNVERFMPMAAGLYDALHSLIVALAEQLGEPFPMAISDVVARYHVDNGDRRHPFKPD